MNPELPKKPNPREPNAQLALRAMKAARKAGKKPLCASCSVKTCTLCMNTGYVICTPRKYTGWIPIPYEASQCGLYVDKNTVLRVKRA